MLGSFFEEASIMGSAKRAKEEADGRTDAITEVMIEHGYLSRCEFHETLVDEMVSQDPQAIYDELVGDDVDVGQLGSQPEILESIKAALANAAMECNDCDHSDD